MELYGTKQQLLGLYWKEKNSEYKSRCSKGSEVDSTHTQIPVSLPMCVAKCLSGKMCWESLATRAHLCEFCLSISVRMWMCHEDIWNKRNVFLAFMYSHSICRNTSTGQSYSYEQERKAIIFPKLFFLKFHVYILKRCPQALSQNHCIFMLRPILPNMAISFRRSKQIKRGKCC